MKRILSILLLLIAANCQAQTIVFDSSSQMSYVNITPVRVMFNDTIYSTRLYLRIFNDNLQTECNLYYEIKDSLGLVHRRGNLQIKGSDYLGWDGNNEYPFQYAVSSLELELLNPEE